MFCCTTLSEDEDDEEEEDEMISTGRIGMLRSCCEVVTKPTGAMFRTCCGYGSSDCLEHGPLGDREATLGHLAVTSRLVYGAGFVDKEEWGKYDPPLNNESWQVLEQTLETKRSESTIQAALYHPIPGSKLGACAIVAYRGTVSRRGLQQDLSVAISGPSIRKAIKEACSFFKMCRHKYENIEVIYITGHSLGGLIAEATASFMDAPGASFNSPGPWHPCLRNLTGEFRPPYEVHLTRDDPLALMFPKPENSSHLGAPIWHPGKNHRICQPYMVDVEEIRGVHPNNLPTLAEKDYVNQRDMIAELYAPPPELNSDFEDE